MEYVSCRPMYLRFFGNLFATTRSLSPSVFLNFRLLTSQFFAVSFSVDGMK